MALKIYWTDFSKSELHQIFDYYRQKARTRVAIKLVEGIIYETLILSEQPLIGQVEELINDRTEGFRFLVHKNYKII